MRSWPLWPWPLTLTFCMDITSVDGNNSWKFQDDTMTRTLSKRSDRQTDRQTDGRTEISVLRAAWSQLKINSLALLIMQSHTRTTWTPPFWEYPPPPHDYPYYWFMSWWRHQMETLSALLAICAGNLPHTKASDGALMFSLICAWINGWVNNGEASDLIRHHAHYDVPVKSRQSQGYKFKQKLQKFNIWNCAKKIYTQHTFLIQCVNKKLNGSG